MGLMIPIARDEINEKLFWAKVQITDAGCWIWSASKNECGYGNFAVNGKCRRAHRVSYVLNKGPIPDGKQIDHICRKRSCVNPEHLEPVTNKENVLRGAGLTAVNARKTHCIKGHEFTEENTRIRKGKSRKGCRVCRACHRDSERKRRDNA